MLTNVGYLTIEKKPHKNSTYSETKIKRIHEGSDVLNLVISLPNEGGQIHLNFLPLFKSIKFDHSKKGIVRANVFTHGTYSCMTQTANLNKCCGLQLHNLSYNI